MYQPPPRLTQTNPAAQLFKRTAVMFTVVSTIGIARLLLPFPQDVEGTVGLIVTILSIGFLPKVDVPMRESMSVSIAAVMSGIGMALLLNLYGDVQPELGLAIVGGLMATICWAGYASTRRRL